MNDIAMKLAAPFPASELGWKPQAVSQDKTKALAVAYLSTRAVMDRLDEACGVLGWEDSYQVLPDNAGVVCHLTIRHTNLAPISEAGHGLASMTITKVDVGSPSEQPDGGDRMKAAFSDALKRAAVKFGVGRYLSRLPKQWCTFDPVKKYFTQTPTLPAWAVPKNIAAPTPAARAAEKPTTTPGVRDAFLKDGIELIKTAKTLPALQETWATINKECNDAERKALVASKDKRKAELTATPTK